MKKNPKTQALAAIVRYGAESTGLIRRPSLGRRAFNRITRKESYDLKVAKQIEAAAKAAAEKKRNSKGRTFLKKSA